MPRRRWLRVFLQIHPRVHATTTALPSCREDVKSGSSSGFVSRSISTCRSHRCFPLLPGHQPGAGRPQHGCCKRCCYHTSIAIASGSPVSRLGGIPRRQITQYLSCFYACLRPCSSCVTPGFLPHECTTVPEVTRQK